MTNRTTKLKSFRQIRNEEGFSLVEVMVAVAIMMILATVFLPALVADAHLRLLKPVEEDVRNAANNAATYFTRYPSSPEIVTATPACEGGAKNITGLLITVSSNSTCLSVWGTPSDFYVRGTHPALEGEYLYSSKEQKYTRTGVFAKKTTTNQGDNK